MACVWRVLDAPNETYDGGTAYGRKTAAAFFALLRNVEPTRAQAFLIGWFLLQRRL
jgi:hypothetical protein